MPKLTLEKLYSTEKYAQIRDEFRDKAMERNKNRRVTIGNNVELNFEDAVTAQYQIQEILCGEGITEAQDIQAKLDVYNLLIPDGTNWKATFRLDHEKATALEKFIGIEETVWVQVDGHEKIYAIAYNGLKNETPVQRSSVRFLCFELTPEMINSIKYGKRVKIGIDHPACRQVVVVPTAVHNAISHDLISLAGDYHGIG